MKTLTQTTTDTVELEEYGPVTLATTHWGRPPGPRTKSKELRLVATSALDNIAEERYPADAIRDLPGLLLLTNDGLTAVRRYGLSVLYSPGYLEIPELEEGTPLVHPTTAYAKKGRVQYALNKMNETDIQTHAFETRGPDGLWALDGAPDAPAENLPICFEISNRYIEIESARAHIEALDCVHVVRYNHGRPGSYDHVPSSLRVVVQCSNEVRKQLDALAVARYRKYTKSGSITATGSIVEEAFVWGVSDPKKNLGDPLGLVPFARTTPYQEPGDEDW